MKNLILAVLGAVLVTSCSSSPKQSDSKPENTPDVIISRIDNRSDRPSWLLESEPFKIFEGKVVSLGMVEIPVTDRLEAGYRLAQNSAKVMISSSIEQRLETLLQNGQEGTSFDANQIKYISAEASKLTTSALRPDKIYWEKYSFTSDSGERLTRYKVFATVTMAEAEFKQAVFNAIEKAKGKGQISEEFKKQLAQHWDKFSRSPSGEE